ncbi:glycosyltransferase [Cohnella faecalis]|uniref:MGDG synthase family glycosyltransferase n=1 Tax=Cohnella faecalis TaxID=2315694 RepID=UPI00361BD302
MNRQPNKIMILYARFGEGHYQAASALRDSFARLGNAEIMLIDLLAESHPFINEFSRFVYRKSYTMWPQMYGWVYEATRGMKADSLFAHWLHSFGTVTMQRVVEREKPDAVIHTFPMMVMPTVTNRLRKKIPMFNVVTDFDLHMRWVHPDVDKYYVATEDMAEQLLNLGITAERVAVTGIPIRSSFAPGRVHESAAFRYGLEPYRPTVLVMAGGYGALSGIRAAIRELTAGGKAQAAIVCGRNRLLEEELRRYYNGDSHISVLGFIDRIDELMGLASCIVTKPGGLTLSEAICAGIPIVLYRPVPGQERNNALYLQNKQAAVVCRTSSELLTAMTGILELPSLRLHLQSAVRKLRQENSSDRICLDILRQLNIMEEVSETPIPV